MYEARTCSFCPCVSSYYCLWLYSCNHILKPSPSIIKLGFKAVSHELGYSLFEELSDILYVADIGCLEQFSYFVSSFVLFRSTVFLPVIDQPPCVLDFYILRQGTMFTRNDG